MKNKMIMLLSFLYAFTMAYAQVTEAEKNLKTLETDDKKTGWRTGAVTSINFSQMALINWAAGGENSMAINGLVSVFANYKDKKSAWDNSLDMGYGLMKQGNENFRKTDDKFDLLSKYGQKAFKDFYYTALVNFKTQFSPGYDYTVIPNKKISNFLAPAYILGAVGLNYQPSSYFNAFIAPATGKITIVNDDDLSAIGAYGVTPGEKTKSEFGGYIRVIYSKNDFKWALLKNVSLT